MNVAVCIFICTLLASFGAAWLGRWHGGRGHGGLAQEKLNRWLIGLSAGAAANSGFIVTGAVGLGYTGGLRWLLLPLGWLLGDIIFWRFFPSRINAYGRRSHATTLAELLTEGLPPRLGLALSLLSGILVTICLGLYIAAQWVAGQIFLAGAFGLPPAAALALFAVLIITYTAIGGFRGSVYVDSLQAAIRIFGTALALAAVVLVARADPAAPARLAGAGPGFLSLLGGGGVAAACGTLLGFAAAALGFGLGQPQILSRYLAGASPGETRAAWWIYIGFVQFTWLAMTGFGVVLRGVMPGLANPEAGVSVFFQARMHPVLTGFIIADVFATIAATSNALLVATGQSLAHDLLPRMLGRRQPLAITPLCVAMGAVTMALSLTTTASVMTLALSSVSLLGAALAPAVMARVLGWRHDGISLIAAVIVGLITTLAWRELGGGVWLNEAAPGLAAGILANALLSRRASPRPPAERGKRVLARFFKQEQRLISAKRNKACFHCKAPRIVDRLS